jgi:long-chain acyl-CoA synthetase
MNGYFNRPELNAARQAGGWHHTNDLGRIEPDGSLTFIGPKTRLIKSAAENIYPTEVEGCLRAHPAVADAAVIGVPDATWGQNVMAVVVLREGEKASAEEIIDHCRERIASYKKPKGVEFVDAIPRQGFAVDYDALDERFGGGGYPGTGG